MKDCFSRHSKLFSKEEMADLLSAAKAHVAFGMSADAANVTAVETALDEAQSDLREVTDAITNILRPTDTSAAALELAKVAAADRQAVREDRAREHGARALDEMEKITTLARARMLKADPAVLEAKPTVTDWMTLEEKQRFDSLQEQAIYLRRFVREAGWAERGGKLLRTGEGAGPDQIAAGWGHQSGEVTGRTKLVPHHEWYQRMRQDLGQTTTPDEIQTIVERYLAGKSLRRKQQRVLDWMLAEIKADAEEWAEQHGIPQETVSGDVTAADLLAEDIPPSGQSEIIADLMATATEINPDATERAAIQHEGDAELIAALREIIAGAPSSAAQGGEKSSGAAGAESFLERQSTEDLKAKADAQAAAEKQAKAAADAAEKKATEDRTAKEIAERSKSADFSLEAPIAGSKQEQRAADERTANEQLSGQKPMFSRGAFYSALTRAVEGVKQQVAPAAQWKALIKNLPGVKQAEIEAVGLNEWLDLQTGKVTKDQIAAFLDQNGVRVEETMLGSKSEFNYQGNEWQTAINSAEAAGDFDLAERINRAWEGIDEETGSTAGQPKFSQWQLPGGENYRELLLTLPETKTPKTFDQWTRENYDGSDNAHTRALYAEQIDPSKPHFKSTHFDQPNILAHVRFNEREDADGKRVLFIEEIQSDWAKQGRKEGFKQENQKSPGLPSQFKIEQSEHQYHVSDPTSGQRVDIGKGTVGSEKEAREYANRYFWSKAEDFDKAQIGRVPSAPFVGKTEAWVSLSLKRMIRYAAENGFDRVAWTTGEQQVERYSQALRKEVDTIEWKKTAAGVHIVGYKGVRGQLTRDQIIRRQALQQRATAGLRHTERIELEVLDEAAKENGKGVKVVDTTQKENELSDAIGKAMADRIRNDPNQSGTIEGENITVSDTGMAGFYDKIVPNVANDILKKLGGGRVGETTIETEPTSGDNPGETPISDDGLVPRQQPSFDITPAMREAAMQGQSLFSRNPRAGALSVRDAEATIARVTAGYKNLPPIQVLANPSQLTDASLKKYIRQQGAWTDVEAVFHDGRIYVFHEQIADEARLEHVLMEHELAHYGLRGVYGPKLDPLLSSLWAMNPKLKRAAAELKTRLGLSSNIEAIEEALVDMPTEELLKLNGWQKLALFVRDWLQSHGFEGLAARIDAAMTERYGDEFLGDAMVAQVVTAAREWTRSGKPAPGTHLYMGDTRLDARLSAGDIASAAFKRWFGDSKVVDAEGRPLVVYHGTADDITVFDLNHPHRKDTGWLGTGVYVTTDPALASSYALLKGGSADPNVMPLYARLENPYYAKRDEKMRIQMISHNKGREAGRAAADEWTKELQAKGHDGVILEYKAEDVGAANVSTEMVVFDPAGVKSTFNRGAFDGSNPDIRFSRGPSSFEIISGSPKVSALVNAVANSPSSLSLFNGVNTQYHKADRLARAGKPQFKAVFDQLQTYLSDITSIAVAAEQKAPAIFRELTGIGIKSMRNYFKGAASEADIAAIGPWLNHGTLYGGASPLEGVVWTDAELRGEQTGRLLPRDAPRLTAAQIPLYRQARAAIAQSMEDGAKAVIYRHTKRHDVNFDRSDSLDQVAESVRQQLSIKREEKRFQEQSAIERADVALERSNIAKAAWEADKRNRGLRVIADNRAAEYERAQRQVESIQADITVLDALIGTDEEKGTITQIEEHAYALIDHGYMPLKRFGNRTVTARDKDGKTQFFAAFDGNILPGSADVQMHQAAAEIKALHPDWKVTTGVRSEQSWQMFQGLSLDALENFLDFLDPETKAELERDATIQEYLRSAVNNRSVLKELIHRKGTPGFSNDVARVLAAFVTSHARNASGMYNIAEAKRLVEQIPQEQGDIQDEAVKLVKYVTEPGEEAAKLRGFLFFHFLGGSVAAAAVNLTQTVLMTAPYLHQFAKTGEVASAVTTAGLQAVQDPAGMQGPKGEALRKAEQEGITAPQQIHHLTATAANNPFSSNRSFRSFMAVWGGMFSAAEVFNRRVAFLAAFDIATANGQDAAGAYEFAKTAVTETQGLYNKGNRPNWSRGTVGSLVFTFKTFSIMYLELLKRLPPQQQLLMLGVLLLASGAEGLPFAEDIEDLFDTLGQWLGFSTNSGKWTGKVVRDTFGKDAERPILKGLGGTLPLDLHSRLGMHNLLPGTAFFKPSEIDKTRDVSDALGPVGGVLKSLSDSLQMLARGKWDAAAVQSAPVAVRNAYNGVNMLVTGESKDTKGRLAMKDVTPVDGFGKAIGFNPQRAAAEGEAKREIILDRNLRTVRQDDIASDWADGILRKDPEKAKDAARRFAEWNRDNPEMRMDGPGMMRSVLERVRAGMMTSEQRFIKSTPKPMKVEAAEALRH